MTALTAVETAQARHNLYLLLSRLYLEGLTAELLPYARALPTLATAIPLDFDSAAVAAAHYALFGLNLFPYERVFLGPAGPHQEERDAAGARHYRRQGYTPPPNITADHISAQLGFMAHLCRAEAEAGAARREQSAHQARQRAQRFLAEHLARWLPPFLLAVERAERPFYTALANLTWQVIGDHLETAPAPPSLPPLPDLLHDENTGLRQIAQTLLAPSQSGFFLSREAIGALGREWDLPRGFGKRRQLLLNLLRSAAHYDHFPAVLTAIRDETEAWIQAYEKQAQTAPILADAVAPWRRRVESTGQLLGRLAAQAEGIDPGR